MRDSTQAGERAPLLRPSSSSTAESSTSQSSKALRDDGETASVEDDHDNVQISRARGSVIFASMGLLIFIQAVNFSILTTTQTSIATDLDAFENVSWLTSSYLIAMSTLSPLMGRLSQVFSGRLCLFCSTLIICTGSIVTSLSATFAQFMIGRVLTGVGAAGVLVVGSIIVIQMASAKRRGLYLGLINTGMTVGVSLGAVIAGAVEPKFGWKILFGAQAPLSLLAGLGLWFGIPADYIKSNNGYNTQSIRQKLARIDYSGAILLIATIFLFLLGLSGTRILVTPLVLSAVALPVFVLNEVYVAKDPVIPVSVLKSRGTLLTSLGTTGFMMARWAVLFYTPVYAQAVLAWPLAAAGSILIPTNAGFATGGLLAGYFHIHRHGSFYMHSLIAMAIVPITLLVLAFITTPHTAPALYILVVFLNGFMTGASLNYALVHVLHLTLPDVHPIVISLVATFRGFAGSFGAAIGGGLFGRVLRKSLVEGFERAGLKNRAERIRQLLGSPALVRNLDGKEKAVAIAAYQDALKALFLAAMGLAVIVVFVQAGTGWKEATKETDTMDPDADEDVEEEEALVAAS